MRERISVRPTHGTARVVASAPVLPPAKSDKEVFWVRTLVDALQKLPGQVTDVRSNKDDSHGQDDVIIEMSDRESIGVQVTELTSELRRKREAIRVSYVDKILALLRKEGVRSEERILVTLLFAASDPETFQLDKPERVVQVIRDEELTHSPRTVDVGPYRVLLQGVDQSQFYVPNVNNIGIDVDFDAVPRSLATYRKAVDYLAEKKSNSKSPWLLIWSVSFWQDKDWLGDELVAYMKATFTDSCFDNVYFAESIDVKGPSMANLEVHTIRE
ncbi:MAG: hypothetical protein ACYTAO_15685 [Planctomycetota bacterium]